MLTQAPAKQQVLILRRFASSHSLLHLSCHLDEAAYTCISLDFNPTHHSFAHTSTSGDHHADEVVRLLEERDWRRAILVAHGIDAGLVKRTLTLAPERVAGLFLLGLAPSLQIPPQETPTMVLTSAHVPDITSRLFTEHIQYQLPNSECVPFFDDSLLNLDRSCAPVAEVLHAFCTLRLVQAN